MNILIIEDEMPAALKLERMLKGIDETIHLVKVLASVQEATTWLNNNQHPDLIFMDIQLSDGVCFEIFENCEISKPIIFTTAYHEYTLQAFKVNSVDYLLKPVDEDELKQAINKYRLLHKDDTQAKLQEVLKQLQPKRKERFLIKVGEHFKSVDVNQINCIYIEERCTFIQVGKDKNYAIDYSLEKVEGMLDENLFFRINRNMMVNFYAIKDIVIYSSNRLKLEMMNGHNSEPVLVSRERVNAFKKWMDR
ncbi:LytR/AlgR family response regulator transcription factor [Labilibacter marinus]|uniref:LytR/AlgR family response regulator transcription factor n=1 Tax=Labilibacter marinus TaxID=1477105 RepID=UPI000834270B|nr:LytTR family DNA-binding domain-containing protein [Labilibacter marinus]